MEKSNRMEMQKPGRKMHKATKFDESERLSWAVWESDPFTDYRARFLPSDQAEKRILVPSITNERRFKVEDQKAESEWFSGL